MVPFRGDLSSPSTPAALVSAAVSAFGPRIDILVNNAAVEVVKPLADLTALDFDRAYHVNVRAPLLLTQAVAPHLPQEGGGRIINISSVGGRAAFANLSLYCSSKAALEGVTRSLAAELGPKGHTVNAVNPGPVQSDMLANIPADLVALQKRTTPMQHRLGEVDDVAQIVAWLASDDSRWVTGQTISASGGLAIY